MTFSYPIRLSGCSSVDRQVSTLQDIFAILVFIIYAEGSRHLLMFGLLLLYFISKVIFQSAIIVVPILFRK